MAHDPVGTPVVEDRELSDVGSQAGAVSGSEDESRMLSHADRVSELVSVMGEHSMETAALASTKVETVHCRIELLERSWGHTIARMRRAPVLCPRHWAEEAVLSQLKTAVWGHGQNLGQILFSFLQFPALARLMATQANRPLVNSVLQGRLRVVYAMHFPGLLVSVLTPRGFDRPLPTVLWLQNGLVNRLGWLWVQLWACHGLVQSPQKIAPRGATHLDDYTLIPWFNWGYQWHPDSTQREHNRAALSEKLEEFVWWFDLLVCEDERENCLHGGSVNHMSCAQCKALWSGVLASPHIIDDDGNISIRFQLNRHIREPGTGNWQSYDDSMMPLSINTLKPECLYECRLYGISRQTKRIVCYADTRRGYYEEYLRYFSAGPGGRALELSMHAICDEDGDGCVFHFLDLRHLRSVYKGGGGW